AGIGTPDGEHEADDEADAEGGVAALDDRGELAGDELTSLFRDQAFHGGDLRLDLRGIEHEPIERDQRGEARRQRQQAIEGHTRRHERDIVAADVAGQPLQDVPPAGRRYLMRLVGAPPERVGAARCSRPAVATVSGNGIKGEPGGDRRSNHRRLTRLAHRAPSGLASFSGQTAARSARSGYPGGCVPRKLIAQRWNHRYGYGVGPAMDIPAKRA